MRLLHVIVALSITLVSSIASAQVPTDQTFQEDRASALRASEKRLQSLLNGSQPFDGIEILVAAGTDETIYSRFGHAMLRFVNNRRDPLSDLVLSFVADVDGPEISYVKGVAGGYRVLPLVRPLRNFLADYARRENRPIIREIIPSDENSRADLLFVLKSWIEGDSEALSRYTFLKNNCAGVLSLLLQEAEISAGKSRSRIPSRLPKYLQNALLTPYPNLTIPNWRTLFGEISDKLSLKSIDELQRLAITEEIVQRIRKLSEAERAFLYIEYLNLPREVYQVLGETLKPESLSTPLTEEAIYRIQRVPRELYQLCGVNQGSACYSGLKEVRTQVWDASTIANKEQAVRELCTELPEASWTRERRKRHHQITSINCLFRT